MILNRLIWASTLMLAVKAQAQYFEYDSLQINNLSFIIEANGDMHRDSTYYLHSQMPTGSNQSTVSKQTLWMGGYDENGELRLAANTYRQSGNDYAPGPVGNNYDNAYQTLYNKVWHLKKSEIEHHITNYNSTGYTIPNNIATWPGNGNTSNGEAQNLAPYFDINSNNIYEPELGDYPLIRGDEALYVIYNDDRFPHTESGGYKIKAEIHHMLYAYESNGEEYNDNTIYSHYEIYNRSTLSYMNFYVSNFLDIDIGYHLDDYIGTDVSRNLVYGYNGTNVDSSQSGIIGYGENPPAYGYVLLNQDLTHSMAYNNNFDMYSGNPNTVQSYYNYMRAKWKPGTSVMHPFDSVVSNHVYTDFPNPSEPENWSEFTANTLFNTAGDKRILSTVYALNFGPGDKICMDNASIFAHDNTLSHIDQISHLFNLTDQVQTFYNSQYDNCEDVSDLSIYETIPVNGNSISIFQDQNLINLELEEPLDEDLQIKVIDVLGRRVYQSTLNQGELTYQLNLEQQTSGTYFIQCSNQHINKSIQLTLF